METLFTRSNSTTSAVYLIFFFILGDYLMGVMKKVIFDQFGSFFNPFAVIEGSSETDLAH